MNGHTTLGTLLAAQHDGLTRLGYGASPAERTAVSDGIASLFYAQRTITTFQIATIVQVACWANDRQHLNREVSKL